MALRQLLFSAALLLCTPSLFAYSGDMVVCYWYDASNHAVGRTQQSCNGSIAQTLYSGKQWSDAVREHCNNIPCSLGAICEGGVDWWRIDGACSCVSDTFILALTPRREGGECPENPAGCPTLEESSSLECGY